MEVLLVRAVLGGDSWVDQKTAARLLKKRSQRYKRKTKIRTHLENILLNDAFLSSLFPSGSISSLYSLQFMVGSWVYAKGASFAENSS